MDDGRLTFAPLSSLGTGGIKRPETWQAISGGDNSNLTVIFGKKHSESDMIGSKHYMEKLSDFLEHSPITYFRANRRLLAHDVEIQL